MNILGRLMTVVMAAVLVTGCGNGASKEEIHTMMNEHYPDATSYGVGRFQVDIPPMLNLVGGTSRYNGVAIEAKRQGKAQFEAELNKEIEDRKHAGEDRAEYFSTLDKFISETKLTHGSLIKYGDSRFTETEAFINIKDTTWSLTKGGDNKADVAERIQFRPEPSEKALPTEKGYAIMYGFIPETAASKNEWEMRAFRIKNNPKFLLEINILNIGKPNESLTELADNNQSRIDKLIAMSSFHYDKKPEALSLSFIKGEQAIMKFHDDPGWEYNFVVPGDGKDPHNPSIQIIMDSGNLPKAEADKLWYSVLGSLKPRPGAF